MKSLMHEGKTISVSRGSGGTYLFEYVKSGKRGIFVAGFLECLPGESIEVMIVGSDSNPAIRVAGKVEWVNQDKDAGCGIVFKGISEEAFRQGIALISNVAYL